MDVGARSARPTSNFGAALPEPCPRPDERDQPPSVLFLLPLGHLCLRPVSQAGHFHTSPVISINLQFAAWFVLGENTYGD